MTFKPSLPSFLRRSAAQIEADEAVQAEYRQALHGRVQKNAEERQVTRGIEMELSVRATLEYNSEDYMKSRLAEALAMQGKFDQAGAVEPSEEKANEFFAIAEAIERDDSETCGCPQFVTETDPLSRKEIRLPVQNVKAFIFSPRHRGLMPLIECQCGDLQVASLSHFPELAKRQAGIEQSNAATRQSSVQTRIR